MRELISNRLFFLSFLLWNVLIGLSILIFPKGEAVLFFNSFYNGFFESTFALITLFGEFYVGLLIGVFFLFYKRKKKLLPYLVSVLLNLLVIYLLKHKVFPHFDRPYAFFADQIQYHQNIKINRQFSFPSGHTSAAFVFFTNLAFAFRDKPYAWTLIFPPILVALSRVILAQHFLIDVFVGSWIGLSISLFSFFSLRIFVRHEKSN